MHCSSRGLLTCDRTSANALDMKDESLSLIPKFHLFCKTEKVKGEIPFSNENYQIALYHTFPVLEGSLISINIFAVGMCTDTLQDKK